MILLYLNKSGLQEFQSKRGEVQAVEKQSFYLTSEPIKPSMEKFCKPADCRYV
ncbi:MAG: hypothetical protein AB1414_02570 [bacterium]